jgi:DNA ligase-associated metallophosphoesterase
MHTSFPFTFGGQTLIADASGGLFWPAEETLVVSDLHLEKGSSLAARRTRHLPPYDTRATLAALARLIDRYRPRRVISLGDSFHDGGGHARMDAGDYGRLESLMEGRSWIWVAGNHDPAPPGRLGGDAQRAVIFGQLLFQHQATKTAQYEISGHYHPKAAIHIRSARVTGRCFVIDGTRLIMPAFGAYTGGLNVLDPAIRNFLSDDFHVALIGQTRVVHMPCRKLVA